MTDPAGKSRLFTTDETVRYLTECQAYTQNEFGPFDAFSVEYLKRHRLEGVQFYQPYGDFSTTPPKVLGLVDCMFISYAMYEDMLAGNRKETELDPWRPEDGKAILWIAAVVSEQPGVLAKCLSALSQQVDAHPYRDRVDKMGLICSGPQGYLLSRAFGFKENGIRYKNGWLFMEHRLWPGEFHELGKKLVDIWGMTRIRDYVRAGRTMWGEDWKTFDFASKSKETE